MTRDQFTISAREQILRWERDKFELQLLGYKVAIVVLVSVIAWMVTR